MNDLIQALNESFNQHASRTAIRCGDDNIDYASLQKAVFHLANILKEQHLTRVAVLGYRSLNAEIAILACFFSRVAVVPLNPRYPHERCEKMMKTAQVDGLIVCPECATFAESFKLDSNLTLLTDKASAEHFSAIHNLKTKVVFDSFRDKLNTYEVPAFVEDRILYILFTSGSTGEPKAVAIPERCLASYSKKILTYYGFNQNDIIAQMADLTFDLSFHDLVSALLSGGCLVIIERKFLFTPALAIKKYEVTVFHAVPSVIGYMERFEHLKTDLLASLRICIFLGEALWYEQVEKLVPACPKAVIYNTYGPTESTVAVAAFKAYDPQSGIIYSKEEKLAVVPLGNGYNHNILEVFDDKGHKLPDGKVGEILISGDQLGFYLGDEKKNAQAFITLNGQRWYRTGDLGAYCQIGNHRTLVFKGRSKDFVKLNGYRVSLLEIDSCLSEIAKVRALAVPVQDEFFYTHGVVGVIESTDPKLASFVREEIAKKLPFYMVPQAIRLVSELPVNNNGKLDRKALAKILQERGELNFA